MIRLLALLFALLASPAFAGGYTGTPSPGAGSPSPIGPQGDPGCSVLPTNGPPAATYGLVCDWAFDAGAGAIYGPKTSGGWGSPLIMTGVQATQAAAAGAAANSAAAAVQATNAASSATTAAGSATSAATQATNAASSATAAAASVTSAATQATNAASSATAAAASASSAASVTSGLLSSTQTVSGAWTFSSLPIFTGCTGYLKGNGSSAPTCSATVPASAIAGLFNGSITTGHCVAWSSSGFQDTGACLTAAAIMSAAQTISATWTFSTRPIFTGCTGFLSGNGSSAMSCSATIPASVLTGLYNTSPTFTAGDILQWSTSGIQDSGVACCSAGITTIVAGAGLTGGGSSGSVTVSHDFSKQPVRVRQTALSGPVDTTASGAPSFLPASGTANSITTQNLSTSFPLCVTAAAGYSASPYGEVNYTACTTSNLTWSGLTAGYTTYLYVTLACSAGSCTITPGSTLLAPIYQWGGTAATTSGQFTFNISSMIGYMGNGSTAPQVYVVFLGQFLLTGGGSFSATPYAYNGTAVSVPQAVPSGTTYSATFAHNLGVPPLAYSVDWTFVNVAADGCGWPVGAEANVMAAQESGGLLFPEYSGVLQAQVSLSAALTPNAAGPSGGASCALTLSAWNLRAYAKRRF